MTEIQAGMELYLPIGGCSCIKNADQFWKDALLSETPENLAERAGNSLAYDPAVAEFRSMFSYCGIHAISIVEHIRRWQAYSAVTIHTYNARQSLLFPQTTYASIPTPSIPANKPYTIENGDFCAQSGLSTAVPPPPYQLIPPVSHSRPIKARS